MSKVDGKFHLKCKKCNHIINDFAEWFSFKQKCPECENKWVDVEYSRNVQDVVEKIKQNEKKPESFWQYFDFLPLMEKSNIISQGEGVIPVDRWDFFEEFAKQKYNINCTTIDTTIIRVRIANCKINSTITIQISKR